MTSSLRVSSSRSSRARLPTITRQALGLHHFSLVILASLPYLANLHGPSRLHHVTLDTFVKTYYSQWGSGTSGTSII